MLSLGSCCLNSLHVRCEHVPSALSFRPCVASPCCSKMKTCFCSFVFMHGCAVRCSMFGVFATAHTLLLFPRLVFFSQSCLLWVLPDSLCFFCACMFSEMCGVIINVLLRLGRAHAWMGVVYYVLSRVNVSLAYNFSWFSLYR